LALYHLRVKAVSRSAGRSATAAAAYRAGARIECAREGRVHDYARRSGVAHAEIIVPDGSVWAQDRSALWNAAEAAEARRNATVAREYELALPEELSAQGRVALARAFGRELTQRYGVGVDIAIHAPSRKGDERNWHAHVLTTTRTVAAEGLGKKTRILDDQKTGPAQVLELRATWAELTNRALEAERHAARVDHRSLAAQREEKLEIASEHETQGEARSAALARLEAAALDRAPEAHVGVAATGMERKAEAAAIEAGEVYEPVTDLGAMRAAAQAERRERMRLVDQALEALRSLHAFWERVETLWDRAETAWSRTVERFGPKVVAYARAWMQERRGGAPGPSSALEPGASPEAVRERTQEAPTPTQLPLPSPAPSPSSAALDVQPAPRRAAARAREASPPAARTPGARDPASAQSARLAARPSDRKVASEPDGLAARERALATARASLAAGEIEDLRRDDAKKQWGIAFAATTPHERQAEVFAACQAEWPTLRPEIEATLAARKKTAAQAQTAARSREASPRAASAPAPAHRQPVQTSMDFGEETSAPPSQKPSSLSPENSSDQRTSAPASPSERDASDIDAARKADLLARARAIGRAQLAAYRAERQRAAEEARLAQEAEAEAGSQHDADRRAREERAKTEAEAARQRQAERARNWRDPSPDRDDDLELDM
jgi:hypothetical protein